MRDLPLTRKKAREDMRLAGIVLPEQKRKPCTQRRRRKR